MAERVKYPGVPMESAMAELLARLDAGRRVPTSGLWLYAIVRMLSYKQMLAESEDLYVLIWLALAAQQLRKRFEILVESEIESEIRAELDRAGFENVVVGSHPQALRPHDQMVQWDHDFASIRYFEETKSFHLPLIAPYGDKIGQDFVITPVHKPLLEFDPPYESAVVGGVWRLYGGRKLTYSASEREKLIAILLAAMQPKTVVLGMNVVFDGKMKPLKSKISFSGTGGQIGAGDVLICHPDDLNRYTPLPGAMALVLGAVTEPVQAFTCPLPVGDEVLTVVIK